MEFRIYVLKATLSVTFDPWHKGGRSIPAINESLALNN